MTDDFTVDDVTKALGQIYPEAKIARIKVLHNLNRFVRMNAIRTVSKGRGRISAVYSKKVV